MLIPSMGSIWMATARLMALPFGPSVQPAAQALQQGGRLVARAAGGRALEERVERGDAPRRDCRAAPGTRRAHTGAATRRARAAAWRRACAPPRRSGRRGSARLDHVVLQAQQHVAVARPARNAPGASSASVPAPSFNSSRSSAGPQPASAMERVDDGALAAILEPDQEMAGKGEAGDRPALGARRMDVEDAQRHRQALAPVDHPHQVGVVEVVVGRLVAFIADTRRTARG